MSLSPKEIRARCSRSISYHRRRGPKETLATLAAAIDESFAPDFYGAGPPIEEFEKEIAARLGKEAAVFMPSGTMAQPIALRLWAERRGRREVALHPTSHLELHEHKGYELLHGLHGVPVGSPHSLFTLDDLKKLARPLGALLIELPQREIGGRLPSWEALNEIIAWAQEESVYLHLDGARLWECQPFYGRSVAQIAAPFDSVYVSFYKTLGAIAGAALAGPADFIAEARIWQRRQGGNLVSLFPYLLAARQGMETHLPRVPDYVARARELAAALRELPRVTVVPDPPHINLMHLHIQGDAEALARAALAVAQERGVWLFEKLQPTALPDRHKLELVTGDASLELTGAEVAELFGRLFEKAPI